METALYTLAGLMLFGGLILAWRRFWVMKVAPESIQGSDLHMLKYCLEANTRAWGSMHLTLKEGADFDDAVESLYANIRRQLEDPENNYQLGVDLQQKKYVRYPDRSLEELVDVVHDDAAFYATRDDERFRELVFRVYPEKQLIGLMFDHTIWDGVGIFNEIIVPAVEARPFGSRWLINDNYKPVLAEIMQLYTIIVMGARWLTYRPMKTFDHEGDQQIVGHRFHLDVVKDAKNRNDVKFTSALLGIWMHKLFKSMDESQEMIRVGVLVGMVNKRFRNNYTIVTVDVRRTDDVDKMIKAIERQFMIRQLEVIPLYHMISCIEAQTLFKKHAIDYLFSPAFFHSHKGVSKLIDDFCFRAIPIGMPFYTFACSIDDVVTITTTVNTPKCDVSTLAAGATRLYSFKSERYVAREN